MASPARKQFVPPTRLEQLNDLLVEYNQLDSLADQLIEEWVDEFSRQTPGVPKGCIRLMEIDARSTGYVHRLALERLRSKL